MTAAGTESTPDLTMAYISNALDQCERITATGPGSDVRQRPSYDLDGNLVERFIAGDMNCDGDVDFDDIDPFVVALLDGQAAYETAYPDCEYFHADVNGDGNVDFDDLDVFLGLVSSGNAAVWVAYTWDAENRLVGVAPGGMPKSGDLKLAFVYDYMGRRVEKKVWTHNGSSWGEPTEHRKFVWNGWLLLMELDGLNDDAVLRKRTWGLDLSGLLGGASSAGLASSRSMLEGAGGIGGLLAVHDATIGQNGADYVYFYDANGNVGQVCDLSHTPGDPAGAIVARYEYDPYGNVTSQSGAYASDNPFRFSTKYFDDETGLGYWGYRYYDPKLGRWVNRDPGGERRTSNTYTAFLNAGVQFVDPHGRQTVVLQRAEPGPAERFGQHPHHHPTWNPLPGSDLLRVRNCRDGCCGPDITESLFKSLDAFVDKYGRMDSARQMRMCFKMRGSDGWDIAELMLSGSEFGEYAFETDGCGTGGCAGTVEVGGDCFRSSEVNYVLWGLAHRLCAQSVGRWKRELGERDCSEYFWLRTAEDLVAFWRLTGARWSHIGPNAAGPGSIECRRAWTRVGYYGNIAHAWGCRITECGDCRMKYAGSLNITIGAEEDKIMVPDPGVPLNTQ